MSAIRKKVSSLLDSDTSDEERNNKATEKESYKMCRSSERLKKKRSKYFHVPSREDVFEKISPTKTTDKYSHLKPRKLINSYIKENSRYNYDANETSGSESMDDFVVNDEDGDDDNDDSDDVTAEYIGDLKKIQNESKPKHKVLNWHKRVIVESDSDSETSRQMPNQESSHENIQVENDNGHICDLSDEHADRKTKLKQVGVSYEHVKNLDGCADQLKESVEVNVSKDSCKGNITYVLDDSDDEIKTLKRKQKINPIVSDSEDGEVSEEQSKVDNQNYISEKDEQIIQKYEIQSTSFLKNFIESSEQTAERNDAECENKIDEGVDKTTLRVVDSLEIGERSSNDLCSDDESSCSSQIEHSDNNGSTFSSDDDSDSSGSTSSNGGDSNEHVTSSRVRVKNIRKQRTREKLFEKFRNERKKRFSKGLEK